MKQHSSNPEIHMRPLTELRPRIRNPRTHSNKQVGQIADSIREFGFTNPILIDAAGGVIAGHGRLQAAKLLRLSEVPTIRLDHMSEAQVRAYVIADNKLAENAGWDEDLLRVEFDYLAELDIDFDLTITGFETAEIDVLLEGADAQSWDEADELPELDETRPAVTRAGDLWILGPHRLLCADATKAESFECLLGGEQAEMVFVDPPYNVPIDGHVCGSGAIKHREFAMATGEMSRAEFTGFLATCLGHFGIRTTAGWALCTARNTSWCLSSRTAPPPISTTSSLAALGVTAQTSGTIPAPTLLPGAGATSWPCTQRSSLLPWWPMRFVTVPTGMESCWTASVAAERR